MSETKASRKHKLDADGTGKNEHKRLCRKDSHEVCHSDIHLNPHLDFLEAADRLYHLGLDSAMDLPALFGDLRLVVMCGSGDRAESIAEYLVPGSDSCSLCPSCAAPALTNNFMLQLCKQRRLQQTRRKRRSRQCWG